jgi:hypothetical protein
MTIRSLLVLLLALAVPAAAQAKEIAKVTVCGESDCATLTRKDLSNEQLHTLAEAVGEADPPAAAAPWYRIEVTVRADRERFSWTQAYVPSEGLVRGESPAGEPVWMTILPDAEPLLEKVTAGLKPFPASRLTGLAEVEAPPAQPAPEDGAPWPWVALAAALLLSAFAAVRSTAARSRRGRAPRSAPAAAPGDPV